MQLSDFDRTRLSNARDALEASKAEGNADNYPKHLGALEAHLALVLDTVDRLTGAEA